MEVNKFYIGARVYSSEYGMAGTVINISHKEHLINVEWDDNEEGWEERTDLEIIAECPEFIDIAGGGFGLQISDTITSVKK